MKKLLILLLIVTTFYACGPQKEGDTAEGKQNPEAGTKAGADSTAKPVLVKVKKLSYEKFEHFFVANGSVEAVKEAFISPEINGQVKKIHVKEGQRVKRGQLLVSLNSDVTKNSIAELKTGLKLAETVYNKRKGLWDKKIGSEIQFLQAKTDKESLENRLKALEAQLDMTQIKAPIDGIVDEVSNKEGELALPGMQLIRLVNLQKVYINADVSESYLPKVEKGDSVKVTLPSYPGLEIEAAILRTGNVVKKENRTFLVQLLLDNKEEKLKPNMLALIRIKDFSAASALVVPAIIIKNDLKGTYLYVVDKEGAKTIARKVYITTGMSDSGNTLINEGLKAGQQVVVEGYSLVKNGMEINTGS
ncbi:MAG: efflux RND transporter periplasmic adaptor subunit [bacterium]|nr:efflux RND transporter periplasmic adaptor subunit [bacterium]